MLLRPELREAIIACARATFPEECCGILVGRELANGALEITRVVPARNVGMRDEGRGARGEGARTEDRYVIDPLALLKVENELLAGGGAEIIVGFFHSHPRGRNEPSSIDLEMARGVFDVTRRFYAYAIVGFEGSESVRCWMLMDDLSAFNELR